MTLRTALFTAAVIVALSRMASAQTVVVSGRVVDERTGAPLEGVQLRLDDQGVNAQTDASGHFVLSAAKGRHVLAISLVGYAFRRQPLDIESSPIVLEVKLEEGAGGFEEKVSVAGRLADAGDMGPGATVLHGRDLQALRGVTLDDPMRALQAMPASSATDDFYSEFAVRGFGFQFTGLTVDGIPTRYLMHAVHGVTDGGSIAMLNSDAIESLALSPGSYPPRYGRHLGAEVNIQTRQGDRSQFRARAGLSGTSATAVAEGPIGERGSWLVSARRSYLDLLLNRLDDGNNLAFGFTDGQVKVALDLTARNHVEALVIGGTSQFDESANDLGANDERRVTGVTWLGSASWRYAPSSKFMVTQRVYATGLGFNNVNNAARVLDDAQFDDAGWRADATWVPASGWIVEAGGDAVRRRGRHLVNRALNDADFLSTVNSFRTSEITQSAYAQVTMSAMPRLRVSPAVRVDRSPSGSSSPASPSIAVDIELHRATKLRAGTGLYQQFPDFEQTYGLHGADALRPQRARHVDAGIAQQLPRNVSLEVTWFARIENDILWARDAEPRRLPSGSVLQARGDARFANALHGKAHGAEAVVRRDAPAGLAGWIGYAYGRHEYTDQLTGAQFFADQDQRHSVSMFGRYALSNRATLGAKFRYGSNYPRVGYIREASAAVTPQLFGGGVPLFYEVSETRNSLRLPAYARLDLRADRTLTWRGRRVTLFAEIANLLNRSNLRNVPYDVDRTGRVFGGTDSLMPILPSAGFVVEF